MTQALKQTGIFKGRTAVPYAYGCFGYTRGGGKTWHGGIDLVGMDDDTVCMPYYENDDGTQRAIRGTVTRARKVDKASGDRTWEWGWYICVQLDADQTPDAVNYLYFCHCKTLLVAAGQKVVSGDALAVMGNSGNAALNDPPYKHCHLEVRATATGVGLDPTRYSGTKNDVGTYGTAALPAPEPAEPPAAAQLQTLCILDAGEDIVAKAQALGLPVRAVQGCEIGPASSGDAMTLWMMAQAAGKPYYASYTEE